MNYKGKVVDTPVAPMTSTGKTVNANVQCEYTKEWTATDFFDEAKDEYDSGSSKKSY